MNISFDLDDTLIPNTKKFLTEPQKFLQKILYFEEIRLGTPILINELQLKGHSIFIYTTSLRSESYIYWLFKSYNISIKNIINQKKHIKATKNNFSSKYPPFFNIDLHIDDSQGVELEGIKYNFKTIILDENKSDWINFILCEIENYNLLS